MSFLSCKYYRQGLFALALFSMSNLFTGCGGSSDTASTAIDTGTTATLDKGDVMISLTDAEGDFLSYRVDVTGMTMTHRNGSQVSVLSEPTQIDFAQYVDTSELLGIANIPYGAYEAAAITLDFSTAQIVVQDKAGQLITAEPVDESGVALNEVTVNLAINDNSAFVVGRGLLPHITLDFDLDASNTIAWGDNTAQVTVTPVLSADILHTHAKPMRMRGRLGEVNTEQQQLMVRVQPFYKRNGFYGEAWVSVDENTVYEVDGEPVTADQGLAALAELDADSAVITMGRWHRATRTYQASTVYAGSRVSWLQQDILNGVVVARDGNTVSVRGALVEHAAGHVSLNDSLTFSVSENTVVNREGERVTIGEISVGSAIKAAGTLISDTNMDVTAGLVRVRPSQISGTVVSIDPLTLDVQLLDRRQPVIFNFSGTGQSAEWDADPQAYDIDTGFLDLDTLAVDDVIKVVGVVNTFGAAPSDFLANSIIDPSNIQGHLVVGYGRLGSETAAVSSTDEGLLLSLEGVDNHHYLCRAGIRLDLLTMESVPMLVPVENGGIFSVAEGRQVNMFNSFSAFITYLNEALAADKAIIRVDAQGYYDAENNVFNSLHLRVALAY